MLTIKGGPTATDGDPVLWKSNSIVRWPASVRGPGVLCPVDAGQRVRSEIWVDWQRSVLNPLMVPVFHPLVRRPASPARL